MFQRYLDLIQIPLTKAAALLGFQTNRTAEILYDVIVTVALLALISGLVGAVWETIRNIFRRKGMSDRREYDALVAARVLSTQTGDAGLLTAGKPLDLDALKRSKHFDQLAEIYSQSGRHRDAAKWFRKAGLNKRAAMEWGRAGKKIKAAKLLIKEGDFESAGQLFYEEEKYVAAANAYRKAGRLAKAAKAYSEGKRWLDSAKTYSDYFADAREAMDLQLAAAEDCLRMLETDAGRAKIAGPLRAELQKALGMRFEAGKLYEVAGKLFAEAGDPLRAGEVFVLARRGEGQGGFAHQRTLPRASGRVAGSRGRLCLLRGHGTRGRVLSEGQRRGPRGRTLRAGRRVFPCGSRVCPRGALPGRHPRAAEAERERSGVRPVAGSPGPLFLRASRLRP
jgi:hypothetical protein